MFYDNNVLICARKENLMRRKADSLLTWTSGISLQTGDAKNHVL